MPQKGHNIGEWSEAYIFLRLLADRKVDVADEHMRPIEKKYLKIISIFRNEGKYLQYRYVTGNEVTIEKNGEQVQQVPNGQFGEWAEKIWKMIEEKKRGETTFTRKEIEDFLRKIYVKTIRASSSTTGDIRLEAEDFRNGITSIMDFSCKSDIDSASSLFNASNDNTNFEYEIVGHITDEDVSKFNNMFSKVHRKGHVDYDIPTSERIKFLKELQVDLVFKGPVRQICGRNLVLSGGLEMPAILGSLLKFYYFENAASVAGCDLNDALNYVVKNNPAKYDFDEIENVYRSKIVSLLYNMFTGTRLGTLWNGKSSVNGGYIVVKRDSKIVAYHSCITEEFKLFLLNALKLDAPSGTRHGCMSIVQKDGKHYLKLGLQIRFKIGKPGKVKHRKLHIVDIDPAQVKRIKAANHKKSVSE